MTGLTLYTNPMSRGRIARWMLEEVGAPYDVVRLDYDTTMKAPDYLAINPMGKVPAVKHGDTVVTECAAICAYLADAFPNAGLAPPLADRGAYYRWLFFAAGPVESAITAKSLGMLAPEDKRAMAGYGTFDDTMKTLESAIAGGGWICGDRFTAADVYVGAEITWGLMFGTMVSTPALEAYKDKVNARPAAIRANALDDADHARQPAG